MKISLRDIGSALLDVLYPEPIAWRSDEEWKQILHDLPRTEEFVLRGNITEQTIVSGGKQSRDKDYQLRQSVNKRLERAGSYLWYEPGNLTQQLILRGKFGLDAEPEVIKRLAREAAYEMLQTDFAHDIDLIIPIPLHPRRLRERGFNQSDIIAGVLSEICHIPMDNTLLTRRRYNKHQANLRQAERSKNSEQLFSLSYPEQLYHKHILLVDDVITTGSTIRACFEAMSTARDCRISVFALGKSR